MTEQKEFTWCFACGKANPIGLKLKFERRKIYHEHACLHQTGT